MVISNVPSVILAKIVEFWNHVATEPPFGENDVELKAFVLELLNEDEQTLFRLLVGVDYLYKKGLFVSYLWKCSRYD